MVPSVFMVTPVKPPSFVILILSSILASAAGVPLASSTPLPLSAKTLIVVAPVAGLIVVPEKSSSLAVIVNAMVPHNCTPVGTIHSNRLPEPVVNPPVLPLEI